jgi:hypothetical protein
MGFLDQSTQNIIVDAVLTDEGRKRLASNNGSFSIDMFAFGDDEVDYGLIKKYGRAVGKEKIEKNTPIFEGLTIGNLEQKYKLIGISNPYLTKLPKLVLTTTETQKFTAKLNVIKFTIKQQLGTETSIDQELIDRTYTIEMNDMLLSLGDLRPSVSYNKIATYVNVSNDVISNTDNSGTSITLTLNRKNISTSAFDIYRNPGDANKITTVVKITGDNTGATIFVPVTIER